MASLRHHARLGFVALAAIAGMLSLAEGASAGTVAGAGQSCCITRPMAACDCCESPASTQVGTGATHSVMAEHGGLQRTSSLHRSASPCECRADEPAAPASKTERPCSDRRQVTERAVGEVRPDSGERPSPCATQFVSAGGSPAKSPLYLRTSRLLI